MKQIITTLIASLLLNFTLNAGDEPSYTTKVTIYFKIAPWQAGSEPTEELQRELNLIKVNLPKGDASVTVRQVSARTGTKTSVFELTTSAPTPEASAERTNQLALSLLNAINVPNMTTPRLLLMSKAMASEAVILKQ